MTSSTLGWSIGVLFRAWHDAVTAALADFPHGARGHQILEFVAQGSLPTQAALAAHLGIDRTVLTYVIDDLVAEGVIERQTDVADRRVRRLAATAAGRRRLAALNARVTAAEAGLLEALPADDRDTLRAVLERAGAAIHRGEPGHDACTVVGDILASETAARVAS
jgi:MarR family transcriptional regulator, transcriptional regulator for hemolysin